MDQTEIISLTDPVVALCTPDVGSALAVIRLSGDGVIEIVNKFWKGKSLIDTRPRTAMHGKIIDEQDNVIDDLVAIVYRGPASFTGQDTVELTCHGSRWITREIVNLMVRNGCRPAPGGEFSRRAFANGKMLLNEAEGIADLIASSSRAAHDIALSHINGSFSRILQEMREELLKLLSLLDLELDFSEEDIQFTDRQTLIDTAEKIRSKICRLADTFSTGSALKDGIPVVIAGCANAGKSTLLNRLLGHDKAIVTDIPGTTRDTIDDVVEINGILFRFIDTAGLRDTDDPVEQIGIERTRQAIDKARTVIWLIDPMSPIEPQLSALAKSKEAAPDSRRYIAAINKADKCEMPGDLPIETLAISAATGQGVDELIGTLTEPYSLAMENETTITNARHYNALLRASESLERVIQGLADDIPTDFVAQDMREATNALGDITGAITPDEELRHIFSSFCIGK